MGLVKDTLVTSISYSTITNDSNRTIYSTICANYTDENKYRTVSPVAKAYILGSESYTSVELLKGKNGSHYRYVKTLGSNPVGFFAYLEPVNYSYNLDFTSAYTLLQEKYLDRDETIQMNWQKTNNRHFNATSYNSSLSYFDTLYEEMYDSFLAVKRCDEESKNTIKDFANAMDFEDVTYVSSYFTPTGNNVGKFYANMYTTNIQNTNLFYKSSDNIFISYDGSVRLFDSKEGWIAAYSSSNPDLFSVTKIPGTPQLDSSSSFSSGQVYSSSNPIYPCYICSVNTALRTKYNAAIDYNDYSVVVTGPYIKTLLTYDGNFVLMSRKATLFNTSRGTTLCQLNVKSAANPYNNIGATCEKIDNSSIKLSFKFSAGWLANEFTERDPYISQDTYQVVIGAEKLCRIRFYRMNTIKPTFAFTTNNYNSADYLDTLTVSLTSTTNNNLLKSYGLKISSVDIVSGTESIFPVHPLLYWSNDTSFKIICMGRGSYKVNITYWHPQLNMYLRETLSFNIKSFGTLKSELSTSIGNVKSGQALKFNGVPLPACVIPKINGVANDYTVKYDYSGKSVTVNINASKPINVLYWVNIDNSISCKYISNGTSSISANVLIQPLALDAFYEFGKYTDDATVYSVETQQLISPFVKLSLSLMEDEMSEQMIGNISNRLVSNESVDYSYLTKLEINQISYHNIPNFSSTETKRIRDNLDILMNSVSNDDERNDLLTKENNKLNQYIISRPDLLTYVNILDTTYTSQNEFAANKTSFGDDFPYKCSPWNVMPCVTLDNNSIDFTIEDFYSSLENNVMYYPTQKNYKLSFKPNENIDPDYYTANINIRLSKKDKINIMFNWKEVHYVKNGERVDGLMINADSLEISGMLDGNPCVAKLQNNCELDIQTNTLTLLEDISLLNEFSLMLCATNSKKRVDLTFNIENYMVVCDDVFMIKTGENINTKTAYEQLFLSENEVYEIAIDKNVLKNNNSGASLTDYGRYARNYLKDNSSIKVKLLFNDKTKKLDDDTTIEGNEKYYTTFNANKSFILNMKEIMQQYGYYAFGFALYVKDNNGVDVPIDKLEFKLAFDGYRKCRTIYRRLLTYPIYYFNDSVSKYFENEHYDDILPDEQFYSTALSTYYNNSTFVKSAKINLTNDYSSINLGSGIYNLTLKGNKTYYPKTIQYSGYFLYYLNYIRLRQNWKTNCDTSAIIYHVIDLDKLKITNKPDKIDILGNNKTGDIYYTGEYEIFTGTDEPTEEPNGEFDEYDLGISVPIALSDGENVASTNLFQHDYFVAYREDILKYWKDRVDAYQYILDVLSEYDENLGLLDILQRYARKTGRDVQEKIAKIGYILTAISQNDKKVSLWVSSYYADRLWNAEANAYMWRNIFEILFENDIDLALINNSILQDIFAFGFFPEIYVCDTNIKYYLTKQGKISTSGVAGLYHYNFNKQGEIETIQVETTEKRPVVWKKEVKSITGYKVTNGVLTYNGDYYTLTSSGTLKKSDKPGTGYSISGKTIIRTIGQQNVSYCSTEDISEYWINYNQDCLYKVSKKNIRTALKIQLYLSKMFLSEIEKSVHMVNILHKWYNVSDKYTSLTKKSSILSNILYYDVEDVIFNKKIIHASDINTSVSVIGSYNYYDVTNGIITKEYQNMTFTVPFPENYSKSIYTYSQCVGDRNLQLSFFLPAYNDKHTVHAFISGKYVVVKPKNERIPEFKIFYKNDMEEPYPWSNDVDNTFDNVTVNNYERISHYSRKDVSGSYNTVNISIKAFNDIYKQPYAAYMVAYNAVAKWGCNARVAYAVDYTQPAHYLGSVTEWQVVQDNVSYINSFLSQLGGDLFYDGSINTDQDSSKYFWTSTEMNGEEAWMMFFDECVPKRMHKHELHYLRAFAKTDFSFDKNITPPTPKPREETDITPSSGKREIRLVIINNDGTFITGDAPMTINTDIISIFEYANLYTCDFEIGQKSNDILDATLSLITNNKGVQIGQKLSWTSKFASPSSFVNVEAKVKNPTNFGSFLAFYYTEYNENNTNIKLYKVADGQYFTLDSSYLQPTEEYIYKYIFCVINSNIHIDIFILYSGDEQNKFTWEYDKNNEITIAVYMKPNNPIFQSFSSISFSNSGKDISTSHWEFNATKIQNEDGFEVKIKPKSTNEGNMVEIIEDIDIMVNDAYPGSVSLKLMHERDSKFNEMNDIKFIPFGVTVDIKLSNSYYPNDPNSNQTTQIKTTKTISVYYGTVLTFTNATYASDYSGFKITTSDGASYNLNTQIEITKALTTFSITGILATKKLTVNVSPIGAGIFKYNNKEYLEAFTIEYDRNNLDSAGYKISEIQAIPNTNFTFKNWTGDNISTPVTTAKYSPVFTEFKDYSITANFTVLDVTYSITVYLNLDTSSLAGAYLIAVTQTNVQPSSSGASLSSRGQTYEFTGLAAGKWYVWYKPNKGASMYSLVEDVTLSALNSNPTVYIGGDPNAYIIIVKNSMSKSINVAIVSYNTLSKLDGVEMTSISNGATISFYKYYKKSSSVSPSFVPNPTLNTFAATDHSSPVIAISDIGNNTQNNSGISTMAVGTGTTTSVITEETLKAGTFYILYTVGTSSDYKNKTVLLSSAARQIEVEIADDIPSTTPTSGPSTQQYTVHLYNAGINELEVFIYLGTYTQSTSDRTKPSMFSTIIAKGETMKFTKANKISNATTGTYETYDLEPETNYNIYYKKSSLGLVDPTNPPSPGLYSINGEGDNLIMPLKLEGGITTTDSYTSQSLYIPKNQFNTYKNVSA